MNSHSNTRKNKSDTNWNRTDFKWCTAILGIALVIRLIYLAQDAHSPFFHYFLLDASQYRDFGRQFSNGEWPDNVAFFRPPLYPLFIGVIFKLFGESIGILKLIQSFLGSLSCVWIFIISRVLLFSRPVAVGAALVCCFSGTMIFFDGQPLSANLDVFMSLSAVLSLICASRYHHWGVFLLAGFFLGLAILVRGSALFWLPVAMIAAYCTNVSGVAHRRWKIRLLRSAFVTIPALLLLAPTVWHNAKYNELPVDIENGDAPHVPSNVETIRRIFSSQFNLIGYAGGINLYLGNLPANQQINYVNDANHFEAYDRFVKQAMADGVTTATECNSYFVKRTRAYIVENPCAWLTLMFDKTADLFNGKEIPRGTLIYSHRQYSSLLSLLLWKKGIAFPAGIVFPLGLLGIAFLWKERRRHWIVWAIAASHAVFLLMFFVTARYRLLLFPLMSIYAASAIGSIISSIKEKRGRLMLLLLPVLAIASNWNVGAMSSRHGSFEYYNLANALQRDNCVEAAEETYRKLLKHYPEHFNGHYNFGYLLLAQNRPREAMYHFQEAIRLNPAHASAHGNLANCYMALGNRAAAITHYQIALRLDPSLGWVRINLAQLKKESELQRENP